MLLCSVRVGSSSRQDALFSVTTSSSTVRTMFLTHLPNLKILFRTVKRLLKLHCTYKLHHADSEAVGERDNSIVC